jgi:2-polyprenyl-6-hydroxyphenyl methylase/3-demethylubiquinone-9 3-methyltransferase
LPNFTFLESGLDIEYQSISAEDLAKSETESFDVIACLEMLEHVPDPSLVIEACSKLVKPKWEDFLLNN